MKNYISKPILPGKSIPSTQTVVEELAHASLTSFLLKYLKKYYLNQYGLEVDRLFKDHERYINSTKPEKKDKNTVSLKPKLKREKMVKADNIIAPPPEFRDEENIIYPPPEFRDDFKPIPPIPKPRVLSKQPTPSSKTKITQLQQALKGAVKSYEVDIKYEKDPLLQLNSTDKGVETYLQQSLKEIKGFKLVSISPKGDDTLYKTAYFKSKLQLITDDTNIKESLGSTTRQLLKRIGQWLSEGSG